MALDKKLIRKEKLLARVLRHEKPEESGVDKNGWMAVDAILSRLEITPAELQEIIRKSNKQRFEMDERGSRVRARQGHSIDVDVELEKRIPPLTLYHGTNEEAARRILIEGLLPMKRNHVHLSPDITTAELVGRRKKGKLVVLRINARKAHDDNATSFYLARNGVWLASRITPEYIELV